MKNVVLLGATGSIGDNTLSVLRKFPDQFKLWGVVACKNIEKLLPILHEFKPAVVCLTDAKASEELKKKNIDCIIKESIKGAEQVASDPQVDIVVSGVSGGVGLCPTLAAVKAGKVVAIANKEPLVMAGELILRAAQESKATILPVDSEHSAIYQCLAGASAKTVKKIYLTASGGPFHKYNLEQLKNATVAEALRHPTWSMGSKITIDSATLMNKALEIIEASWLFNVACEQIEVIVQPSSIIHSMVEFVDGSTVAQLGVPSMELPIQYALLYPERLSGNIKAPDWVKLGSLQFDAPNPLLTRSLEFAYRVAKEGGAMGIVLNAANEVAVERFLKQQISFLQIYDLIGFALSYYRGAQALNLDEILELDQRIRMELTLWHP